MYKSTWSFMSNGLHNHLPLQYSLYIVDIFPWIGLYRTGSPINFRQKSPSGRQFGRGAYCFWYKIPTGSAIWAGLIIGTKEYALQIFCKYKGFWVDFFAVMGFYSFCKHRILWRAFEVICTIVVFLHFLVKRE